ncbi:MAG: hypothetical protein LC808_32900, partial [Actinobacteria bacterium]|nr:hypothetical protein [Actinomycetota bacterium]
MVTLVVFCTALNGAGFAWNLFEPVPLYDEVAHLLTPLVLVAIVAEIVYRGGGDDEFFHPAACRHHGLRHRPRRSDGVGGDRDIAGPDGRLH